MPRPKPDRVPAALAALPTTRPGMAIALNVSLKVASDLLKDMVRANVCHVAGVRVQNERGASTKLFVIGPAPAVQPKQFNRETLLPKRFKANLPDEDEPRIDPTLRLYREPLNALFGMHTNANVFSSDTNPA